MCFSADDCQDNSLCYLDEAYLVNTGIQRTICQCNLGYWPVIGVDPTNDVYPKTGTCVNQRTDGCLLPDTCMEDTNHWGVCPYCRAFKHTDDFGGELSLGTYVSGEGTFDSDPMVFSGGDSINCGNGAQRSSVAYWYCWYLGEGKGTEIVPLNSFDIFWQEEDICSYSVYIYTPLACQFELVP